MGASLVSYVGSLPVSVVHGAYDATSLVEDLLDDVKAHVTSNLIVVPILQTFNLLLEGGALNGLSDSFRGIEELVLSKKLFSYLKLLILILSCSLRQLLSIVTRNVARLKSIPRTLESMKMSVPIRFHLHFLFMEIYHLASYICFPFSHYSIAACKD